MPQLIAVGTILIIVLALGFAIHSELTCDDPSCKDDADIAIGLVQNGVFRIVDNVIDLGRDGLDLLNDADIFINVLENQNTRPNSNNVTYQYDIGVVTPEQHRTIRDGNRSRLRLCPFINNSSCPQLRLIPENSNVTVSGIVPNGGRHEGDNVWFRVTYGNVTGYIHNSRIQPVYEQDPIEIGANQSTTIATIAPPPTATTPPPTITPNPLFDLVQSHDESVVYPESWTVQVSEYGDDGYFLVNTGVDPLSFSFTGSRIEIVYIAGQSFGNFDVMVDGVHYGVVSSSSGLAFVPNQLFAVNNLTAGEHTLTIQPQGSVIAIDAFIIHP